MPNDDQKSQQKQTNKKEKIEKQQTTKTNKQLDTKQTIKNETTKTIQNNIIPENEPRLDTTKMNTAGIIQNTYVEYLPSGTKRDRYRKEFLKNN